MDVNGRVKACMRGTQGTRMFTRGVPLSAKLRVLGGNTPGAQPSPRAIIM